MDSNKSILVVSAHAADFVWRAGGAIALYAQRGYRVRILCLSYGERGEFKPQLLLDITPVYEIKRKAMESMEAQEHLWEYYSDLARRRGTQAVRNSGRKEIRYAEAFQRVYPQVASDFS